MRVLLYQIIAFMISQMDCYQVVNRNHGRVGRKPKIQNGKTNNAVHSRCQCRAIPSTNFQLVGDR